MNDDDSLMLPDAPAWHAWVDESIRVLPAGGFYILAAVIADSSECESTRDAMRAMLVRKHGRLHWRDENADRRHKIAAALSAADVTCLVIVGTHVDGTRQERARRLCFEQLLHRLDTLSVSCVWMESRTQSLNRKDVKMVKHLRGARTVTSDIRLEFALPRDEPMLWAADAVAGAANAKHNGNPEWFEPLASLTEQIEVKIR
ncbi:hypothetical protein [Phytoactinopolyspora halotolerans]|uniref:DUF3800 domain-containing protein n=1 Tax=Phytoactinopolyspora halotolerans TaxID=1981512 RepID=A0A6L9S5Q7_9ACTN|nr:hypothetical protein [Phytoactinopolyspora halotolerans]NED99973.1 hypothetical protein [Phytoactinopolyspora halotolerans]